MEAFCLAWFTHAIIACIAVRIAPYISGTVWFGWITALEFAPNIAFDEWWHWGHYAFGYFVRSHIYPLKVTLQSPLDGLQAMT